MIWQHFYKKLLENKIKLDLSNSILIHGGGWKKLITESISSDNFRKKLNDLCGIKHIHDYYGMVEQTGSIYMECENGYLHTSIYSDVIIRRASDFSEAEKNEKGIIQVLSILPFSYPGHSLLTEDEGILIGEDNCTCGRLGKYFTIVGRLKNAEIRGCSDTYVEKI
jgi:phenylacetate-coenzyme A ligase PaaK-like adenylate-forming protein